MDTAKVGIREFRAGLASYLAADTPVAIMRHGQTVGFFIPTPGQTESNLDALKRASDTLDQWLRMQGVDAEEVVAEFKAARRSAELSSKAATE